MPTPTPPIPDFSSDEVGIRSWERMDHGGHSFVFKVSIDGRLDSVVKIFRFLTPIAKPITQTTTTTTTSNTTAATNPNLYFDRESSSHALLHSAGLSGTLTPQIHGTLRISATHERHLLTANLLSGFSPSLSRRRYRSPTMPLRAVWMEFIPGRRMAKWDVQCVGEEVVEALRRIHACGVVQGDVKWRNILVLGEEEVRRKVVWIDFSNAVTRGGCVGGEEEGWKGTVEGEMARLRDMLWRFERASPAPFEFEAVLRAAAEAEAGG